MQFKKGKGLKMSEKNNKFYTKKKVIDGVEYTAQFNGLSYALKTIDESYIDNSSNLSMEKLNATILENVIVDPKVTIDDFDDIDTLRKVVEFGQQVMQGKFRDKK